MSHRANPTLIGAFVVGALALAVVGALILGGRHWFARPQTYVMFFDGSVAGLAVGSPVQYRGVPLGSVTAIRAVVGANQIAVFVGIDVSGQKFLEAGTGALGGVDVPAAERRGIERGIRAQLQTQSLVTGQLYVALDYFPDTPARLTGLDPQVPEIPTVPTTVQQAFDKVQHLVARLEALPLDQLFMSTVGAVDAVRALAESRELRQALTNINAAVRDARSVVVKLEAQVGPVAGSARRTLDEARLAVDEVRGVLTQTVRTVDQQLDPLVASTNQTLEAARALALDSRRLVAETSNLVTPLAASATSAADAARVTLEKAQSTLANTDGLLNEETPLGYQLGQTLAELADAARSVRVLADALERQPSSLVFGKRPAAAR
jgi:paraquat-inducible protein B